MDRWAVFLSVGKLLAFVSPLSGEYPGGGPAGLSDEVEVGRAGAVGLSHCDFLVWRFTKNLCIGYIISLLLLFA